RNMNPYILKVARVRNPEYIEEKNLFGKELLGVDQIISPESVMVDTIRNLMMVPGASDIIEFENGRVQLVGITIKPDSPFAGRQLTSFTGMEGRILVGAIVRGEQFLIPHGEDFIQANDLVYLVIRSEDLPDLFPFLQMENKELKMVIIVGAGQTGQALASALDKTKINVKIIDRDARRCEDLAETLEKVTVIHGDATDKNLLQEENISDADFMIAITNNEESNVLITLLSKGLGVRRSITRVNKLSYIPLISAIGVDTIVSSRLSAIRAILQYIRKGRIISVAPLKSEHAEAIEAEALETSDIVNRSLAEVKFPKGALVGAVVRDNTVIIPKGDTVIQPNDRLIIFTLRKEVPKLEKLLTVKLEYF
ncbi:MAG: Trk system potassium transporter TrkA, partial [Deltaproteobacteria bacterium]|nr:Trk system potassium transporter TrkA [Deltaproteobacteria bacterium]